MGGKIGETDRPDLIVAWKAVKGLTELQRHLSAREPGWLLADYDHGGGSQLCLRNIAGGKFDSDYYLSWYQKFQKDKNDLADHQNLSSLPKEFALL